MLKDKVVLLGGKKNNLVIQNLETGFLWFPVEFTVGVRGM